MNSSAGARKGSFCGRKKRVGFAPLFSFILLAFALPSCALLSRARAFNEKLYLEDRLGQLEALALPMPSPGGLLTPFPLLTYKDSELQPLFSSAVRLDRKDLVHRLARLMGRGDLILRHSTPEDTLLRAEGFLLSGNAFESLRLLRSHKDSPLYPFALLASGDSLRASASAEALLAHPRDRSEGIELRLARLQTALRPDDPSSWSLLASLALSDEERRYASLRSALSGPSASEALKEAVRTVFAGALPEPWSHDLAQRLLPMLLSEGRFVSLYDVWATLPAEAQSDYPFSMLSSLKGEIDLLRSYERPAVALPGNDGGTFRERYGDVPLAPNWAMVWISSAPSSEAAFRPSEETYEQVKRHLSALLVPLRH